MISFNFFDSNDWEVVSNEAMKDKIKALEDKVKGLESRNKELIKLCDEEYDKNKDLEAANEKLRELNEGIRNSDELSWKAKYCVNIQYGAASRKKRL